MPSIKDTVLDEYYQTAFLLAQKIMEFGLLTENKHTDNVMFCNCFLFILDRCVCKYFDFV